METEHLLFLSFLLFSLTYCDLKNVHVLRFRSERVEPLADSELEPEVLSERRRVLAARAPLRLRTIGNINAGI